MTLKEQIVADLSNVFLSTDEFADDCVYTPESTTPPADPVVITGIQTGYPTILTAVAHGLTDGATITLTKTPTPEQIKAAIEMQFASVKEAKEVMTK